MADPAARAFYSDIQGGDITNVHYSRAPLVTS